LVVSRLRLESERACDEAVVADGTDRWSYAQLLLRVAKADRDGFRLIAASRMAWVPELESRIVALVDSPPRPPPSRRATVYAVIAGVLAFLPPAAISVAATPARYAIVVAGEPDQRGDSLASPDSELLPIYVDDGLLASRVSDVLAGPDSAAALPFVTALAHEPQHRNDFVRERARWVISRVTEGRLVEPMLESLGDPDWRVQAYAAWALAVLRDSRAVTLLLPLMKHPVWRLRAMAAYALATSHDPRAADAMREALTDPAWQVRLQATEYLGAAGGATPRDLIRRRLDDRHPAVRREAALALGILQP
jgi:HEAT repeat protein